MALLLEQAQDVFGVFRFVGIEPFAVEQFQGIEYRRGLLGAVLAGDGAQGILRGLVPVGSGDEHRKEGIFRCLILEMRLQTNAGNRVHQVAEVDALMGADAGQCP